MLDGLRGTDQVQLTGWAGAGEAVSVAVGAAVSPYGDTADSAAPSYSLRSPAVGEMLYRAGVHADPCERLPHPDPRMTCGLPPSCTLKITSRLFKGWSVPKNKETQIESFGCNDSCNYLNTPKTL